MSSRVSKRPVSKEGGLKALIVNPQIKSSTLLKDMQEPPLEEGSLLLEMVAVGICGTDREIADGQYGWAPPGKSELVLGHESLGRVLDCPAEGPFKKGDLVVGIVRRPDPVPCLNCGAGEWDMCRNGQYTERGIKERNGFMSERFRLEPEFAIKVEDSLGELAVLLEPTSVVAKAWEHTYKIGERAKFLPESALITGAGPVGLLAALLGKQRGLDVHVLDRVTSGPKVALVKELGGKYHSDLDEIKNGNLKFDIILECTGATSLLFEISDLSSANGVICLAGVSSGAHLIQVDVGTEERQMVLENQVIFGSVNAGKRHYEQAAKALANANHDWLKKLITRRVPLNRWQEAFALKPDDIKNIIVGAVNDT
jgi:threonine dehydrogenase-like Zn-dependent dehydrogenase